MLKFITDESLLAPGLIVAGVADVKVARNIAAIDAVDGAVARQEVAITGVGIFLIAGQQREARSIVGIPRQRRRNGDARLFIILDLAVLAAGDTVEAIEQVAVVA